MGIAIGIVGGVVAGLVAGIAVGRAVQRRVNQRNRVETFRRILHLVEEVAWAGTATRQRARDFLVYVAQRASEDKFSDRDLNEALRRLLDDIAESGVWEDAALVRMSAPAIANRDVYKTFNASPALNSERVRERLRELARERQLAETRPKAIDTKDAPEPPRDPPRTSYGYINAPHSVVADVEFEVEIGLSAELADNVASDRIERPASIVGPYFIDIHVTAYGFRLPVDERWTKILGVTADAPYPTFKLHLRAAPQSEDVLNRSIKAIYIIAGQTVGIAARPIRVRRAEEIVASDDPPETTTDFSIPVGESAPDLTLIIVKLAGDRIGWTYHSPHGSIGKTSTPIEMQLGDAKNFARDLVADMHQEQGQATLFENLKGKGRRISWKIPVKVLGAIRKAGKLAAPNPPTIFILSEEPYVPWELAVLDPPLSDASAPPFLAAQATVGRWVLVPRQHARTTAPRLRVDVGTMAVVAGEYRIPGYARLIGAEDESAQLQLAPYVATPVNASVDDVMLCIRGTPKADVMHFAMHGTYDTSMPQDGLITIDGQVIRPDTIAGSDLPHNPFVFLNACQVGSSSAVLGDYAGMAAAFITAGAAGVIAPLWSIKDGVARDMAMNFYRKALIEGEKPAAILRDERRKFVPPDPAAASTYLAYLFFGHPELKLAQSKRSH